jgi:hypothetical protein
MGEAKRRAQQGVPARQKVEVVYDCDPRIADQGATYFHCVKCVDELPDGISPEKWSRQQLAIREDGYFQLRCTRHDINIAVIKWALKKAPLDG